MPYGSNRDLNAATKKAHPSAHGQTVFRSAFNNALQHYGDEETAFRVAHAAADKSEGKKPKPSGKPRRARRARRK